MMQSISQLKDIAGRKVLLRADFDVAINPDGSIRAPFRVQRQKEIIDYLTGQGARLLIVAHISATSSFSDIADQLGEILKRPIRIVKNFEERDAFWASQQQLALLENVRNWPGEEANDDAFAAQLAQGADMYVNNAFAACHRNHASIAGVARHLSAYAGTLIEKEVHALQNAVSAPAAGKIILISGAKGETKVPVVKYLIDKADTVIVGGAIAHDILKMRGTDVGTSIADDNPEKLLAGLNINDPRLVLPVDFVTGEKKFLDIGAQSVALFTERFKTAKLVVWNGPFGEYEDLRYAVGTIAVAQAILASGATTVVGGGDTISALDRAGLLDRFGFISTGGGAMLTFLAGEKLPGLEALGYYT